VRPGSDAGLYYYSKPPHEVVMLKATFVVPSLDNLLAPQLQRIPGFVDRVNVHDFRSMDESKIYPEISANLDLSIITRGPAELIPASEEKRFVPWTANGCGIDAQGQSYEMWRTVAINFPMSGSVWLLREAVRNYNNLKCSNSNIEVAIDLETVANSGMLKLKATAPKSTNNGDLNSELQFHITSIESGIKSANEQIGKVVDKIPLKIKEAIDARRARIGELDELTRLINIPIKINPAAPSLVPKLIEVIPVLPPTPSQAGSADYAISSEVYEWILNAIRHQCISFEKTPSTFANMGEEDLRNLICSSLNMYFEGAAKGEVFNLGGRADILIETKNRAAFIAECKIWHGAASATGAVDQLLRTYLTWRDSKAAIIMFNKEVEDFTVLLDKLPVSFKEHPNFVKELPTTNRAEWRMEMKSIKNTAQIVTVHVFAMHLPANLPPRRAKRQRVRSDR
jgi:hypothetical protein